MVFLLRPLVFFLTLTASAGMLAANAPQGDRAYAKWIVGGEAYGQGIWYSLRASHRFHANGMVSVGHSFIEIPPIDSTGKTVSFHIVPVSLSALWQLPFTSWPIHLEGLFGGNFVIGPDPVSYTHLRRIYPAAMTISLFVFHALVCKPII